MNNKPLRLAQIGVGGYGQSHLNTIQPFIDSGDVQLVCVADPAVNRLKEKKAEFEAQGIQWYTDYPQMLEENKGKLDIVNIATPIPLHFDMAKRALQSGAYVHLEKPPVPTIGQLDDLIALDKENKVNVAFQQVSNPIIMQARRWVEAGLFGKVISVSVTACWPRLSHYYGRASWPGKMVWNDLYVFDGPATNANSHWVNNIMFILGKGNDYAVPDRIVGEFYRARRIESYDTCSIGGTLPGGTEFTINFTHAGSARIGNDLHLIGEKGTITINEADQSIHNSLGLEIDEDLFEKKHPAQNNYRQFIAYIRGEVAKQACTLENTRGYVATTIGGLISSGQIHDIPDELISTYQTDEDEGYEVEGIADAIRQASFKPALFSQLAPKWGKAGKPIAVKDIAQYDLRKFFPQQATTVVS